MEQKEFENILKKIFLQLNALQSRIKKDLDKEAIHDFRVTVKKLRAFLRLLNLELDKKRTIKLPQKLKDIYLTAGKTRDLQLQLNRLDDLIKVQNTPTEYIRILNIEIERQTRMLQNKIDESALQNIADKIIKNLPDVLEPATVKIFFEKKMANIKMLLSAESFLDDELHSIRKNIKDIIYILKITKEEEGFNLPDLNKNKGELKKMESLAHELGKFNDGCTALSFFQPVWLNKVSSEEKKALKILLKQWKQDIALTKSNLLTILAQNF